MPARSRGWADPPQRQGLQYLATMAGFMKPIRRSERPDRGGFSHQNNGASNVSRVAVASALSAMPKLAKVPATELT